MEQYQNEQMERYAQARQRNIKGFLLPPYWLRWGGALLFG